MNQNSLAKGKLVYCPKCHKPAARVNGNDIHVIKNQGNKPMSIKIPVKHTAGGRFDIFCESCGDQFVFATASIALPMKYCVVPKKNNPVDKSS